MSWEVHWTEASARDLRRIDAQAEDRIRVAIRRYAETEYGDIRRLQGRERQWRLRAGDWRVIFTLEPSTGRMVVLGVRHRSDAYRG